jgi:phosphomannomutase
MSKRWLQSYSGVRAVVGKGPSVREEDKLFAFRHAYCYAVSRLQANPTRRARLVLARDPRPTGEALAAEQAMGLACAFRDLGVKLDLIDLGIVTIPVWQHSVRHFGAHGGVMVTASHNPLDDNGWKYATGVATHGVDPAPPGALLSPAEMGNLIRAANAFTPQRMAPVGRPGFMPRKRTEAVGQYLRFIGETYETRAAGEKVVLDPNGGAACGIAEQVFATLGVEPVVVNGELGVPKHPIDVEVPLPGGGHVLDDLAVRVREEGALFGLAYDFDADRGNLTYVGGDGRTAIPSPQAAAAINTAIALALHRRAGAERPAAVVVSDGTSLRVTRIAEAFGALVCEVETGEINVVTKMRDLELEGYAAVVGVEGPNGGTVVAGTTCRDGSLVGAGALLAAADEQIRTIVRDTLPPGRKAGPGVAGFLAMLPYRRTLAERRTVKALAWPEMTDRLEASLPEVFSNALAGEWEQHEVSYTYTRYSGPSRPYATRFGWKVRLSRPDDAAFLWFRPSATEASVLRMIADAPNTKSARRLLEAGAALLSAALS